MSTDGPVPEAEVIAEHTFSTENGDTLECGIIEINDDRQPVAYAQLGETTVSITRDSSGRVTIEIDDVADEPVYVSANTYPLLSAGHLGYGNVQYMPWTGDEMKEANEE
jgi:hypothetical protein